MGVKLKFFARFFLSSDIANLKGEKHNFSEVVKHIETQN